MVLFIGGVLQNATLTLYDEPTANLDNDKKIKIFQMLRNAPQYKIVITHDLNLAFRLGYRVLYLKNGKIHFDGTNGSFFKIATLLNLWGWTETGG